VASSPAALVVNVSPSTSCGCTCPVPTSQTTRAAISVVLPEPAPAMTTAGSSGALTAANCCALSGNSARMNAWSAAGVGSGLGVNPVGWRGVMRAPFPSASWGRAR
jgi:hypothetical protein